MKMTENYKIIGSFIKDMSSETPDTPTYIFARDKISRYKLNLPFIINITLFIKYGVFTN